MKCSIIKLSIRCRKFNLDYDDEDEVEDIKEQQEEKMLEILKKEKIKPTAVLKKSVKKIIKDNYK